MHFKDTIPALIVMMTLSLITPKEATPCGGTPITPSCPRTVYLAQFTPEVVVIPDSGGSITVPVGVLPYVLWNGTDSRCATPVAATLTLTLTCTPVGGGQPVVIGPVPFVVPVPVAPGAQHFPAPIPFVIPAGIFPPGSAPHVCTVTGTYSVTFGGGVGASTIAGTGETEVCLVEPAAIDPSVPRLEMEYLQLNGQPFNICRRGDQAYAYFLIANNDVDHSVSLTLSSEGQQNAVLPDGFTASDAYANGVFSISHPGPGTDVYPAAFVDNLLPGALLPEPDPFEVDPRAISQTLVLAPGEARIVGIAMRSFGMCTDGSCNERNLKASGSFSNGDPALACVSTLLLVEDVPGKTPLCEFTDVIKSSPFVDAVWQPAVFHNLSGPIPNAETFYQGNLPNGPGFRTMGLQLPNPDFFPDQAANSARLDQPVDQITYSVTATNQSTGRTITNNVVIQGSGVFVDSFFDVFFVIEFDPSQPPPPLTPNFDIFFDLPLNQLEVFAGTTPLYQGPIDQFLELPPPPLAFDPLTCRAFSKNGDLSDKTITVLPRTLSELFQPNSNPSAETLQVIHDQTNLPASWNATVNGSGLALPVTSGFGNLPVDFNLLGLPAVPQTSIAFLSVTSDNAVNDPVIVPAAIRVLPPLKSLALVVDKIMNFNSFGTVEGEVHSNRDIAFGSGAPSVVFGNVTVFRDITIDGLNTIEGDVTAGGVATVDPAATVTGSVTSGAAVTKIPVPTLGFGPFGGSDVFVSPGGEVTVVPGSYDVVRCSTGAVIHFSSGLYDLNRLVMDAGTMLKLDLSSGPVTINVDNRLLFRRGSEIVIESPTGSSRDIFINYDGTGKLLLAKDSRIQGNIVAPTARVKLAPRAGFLGTICARRVDLNRGSKVRHHSVPGGIPKSAESDSAASRAFKRVEGYQLKQNYPNPFNPSTQISFALPEVGEVNLVVYDLMGNRVKTLVNQTFEPGVHQAVWRGRNQTGEEVAGGLYFYRLMIDPQDGGDQIVMTNKMTYLK